MIRYGIIAGLDVRTRLIWLVARAKRSVRFIKLLTKLRGQRKSSCREYHSAWRGMYCTSCMFHHSLINKPPPRPLFRFSSIDTHFFFSQQVFFFGHSRNVLNARHLIPQKKKFASRTTGDIWRKSLPSQKLLFLFKRRSKDEGRREKRKGSG